MIWLKRLLPFVLIASAWYGYDYYRKQQYTAEVSRADQIAQVTSQLWLADAKLRGDSAGYLAFRDSLFKAEGLSQIDIDQFMAVVKSEPQDYDTFAVMLRYYIDSLAHKKVDTSGVDSMAVDTAEGE